jgi:hypothetical protein
MALRSVLFGVLSRKLSNVGQSLDRWKKFTISNSSTLSRWSRLHLQSLVPTNLHWASVVCYGPLFLCVIHKEDLCSSSGDINRLMMNTSKLKKLHRIGNYANTSNKVKWMCCMWKVRRVSALIGTGGAVPRIISRNALIDGPGRRGPHRWVPYKLRNNYVIISCLTAYSAEHTRIVIKSKGFIISHYCRKCKSTPPTQNHQRLAWEQWTKYS